MYADLLERGRSRGEGGLSPRSVRYAHTVLRKALAAAAKRHRVVINVADLAEPPKPPKPPVKVWTVEQVRGFLEHAKSDRLHADYRLSAMTGMRRGEVLGLAWNQVDLETGTLNVRQALVLVDHVPTVSLPKTERGARPIALDADTVAALRAHRKQQAAEQLRAGEAWANVLGLVFTDELGAPVKPDAFSKRFGTIAKLAKLPRLPLKVVRHSHATLAMAAGVHPRTVSDRLGHASVAFTLTTYTAAVPQLQRDAADTLAALVNW